MAREVKERKHTKTITTTTYTCDGCGKVINKKEERGRFVVVAWFGTEKGDSVCFEHSFDGSGRDYCVECAEKYKEMFYEAMHNADIHDNN